MKSSTKSGCRVSRELGAIQHIGLVEDLIQRQDLEGEVDAQLENIRAQLSRIGSRDSPG